MLCLLEIMLFHCLNAETLAGPTNAETIMLLLYAGALSS